MKPVAIAPEAALDHLAADHFWAQAPSPGLGSVHLLSGDRTGGLQTWSQTSAEQVEQELYWRIGREHPAWSARRASQAARSARAALAEAIYRQADADLRTQAAALMRQAALELGQAASDPDQTLALLARLHACKPGRERIGKLEALGLSPRAASGLDLQMANFPFARIAGKLQSRPGLALPSHPPLSLSAVQAGLQRTAGALRALATRLRTDPQLHVFDLCPALARGLLSRLPPEGLAHQAIGERLDHHAACQRIDGHLALVANLVFQIGALLAGPLGQAAQLAWGGLESAQGLLGGTRQSHQAGLSWLAGGMDDKDLARGRARADRAQVLGAAGGFSQVVTGGSLLVSLIEQASAEAPADSRPR